MDRKADETVKEGNGWKSWIQKAGIVLQCLWGAVIMKNNKQSAN